MKHQTSIEDAKIIAEKASIFTVNRCHADVFFNGLIGNIPSYGLPSKELIIVSWEQGGELYRVDLESNGLNHILWDDKEGIISFPENGDNDTLFEIQLFAPLNCPVPVD